MFRLPAGPWPAALDRGAPHHYKPFAVSEGTQSEARPSKLAGLPRTGRTTGVVIFWVLAAYFVGASVYSVTSELFGDGLHASAAGEPGDCARELSKLSVGLHTSGE